MEPTFENLRALAEGRVSGRISDWPMLKTEAREVLDYVAELEEEVSRLEWQRDPMTLKVSMVLTPMKLCVIAIEVLTLLFLLSSAVYIVPFPWSIPVCASLGGLFGFLVRRIGHGTMK